MTLQLPSGTFEARIVPAGIPDTEKFGMEAGSCYNRIYTGGEEYEFHSVPPGVLPSVKSGLKTEEYELMGLCAELELEGLNEELRKHGLKREATVLFKKR